MSRHTGRHRTPRTPLLTTGRATMATLLLMAALPLVVACGADASASSTNDPRNEWVQIGEPGGNEVFKYCDGPNLVYVADGYEAVGITVVETSAACR